LKKEELEKWVTLFADRILETNPEVIGFSMQVPSEIISMAVARKIKERDASKIIVFGGPECLRARPELYLDGRTADFIVRGEGEVTLLELLKALENKTPLESCDGIGFRSKGTVVVNKPRKPQDLDQRPFPDFSVFDREKYEWKHALPMVASRGCIRKCAFCVDTWRQEAYATRRPEDVVAEMEHLIKTYKIELIHFNDLLLNGDLKNLEKICDLMIQKNLKVLWCGQMAVRKIDASLFKKMRATGCSGYSLGMEHASQKVVNLMRKNFNVKDGGDMIRNTFHANIHLHLNWIIGFPGEEREDLIEGAKFVLKHRRYIYVLCPISILAINQPALIAREAESLGIQTSEDPIGWRYKDNVPEERTRRCKAFVRFVEKLQLSEGAQKDFFAKPTFRQKIGWYLKGKRALRDLISEIYEKEAC
jgi:anaerobic magnesium-protoporphyrin IX monomethyl ester cyclase